MVQTADLIESPEDFYFERRQQKSQRRATKKKNPKSKVSAPSDPNLGLNIREIRAKTTNQERMFAEFYDDKHLCVHGVAGSGKSFLGLYLAFQEIFEQKTHQSVKIVRSAVATRDIGHLPGSAADKMAVYEAPYVAICKELFNRGDAYKLLKQRGVVEFIPTSFIRGTTIDNSVIIVDEAQNLTAHELESVITRCGKNTRLIILGDHGQTDFKWADEKGGFPQIMKILRNMKSFGFVEMGLDDIVRSGMVREFLVTKYNLGM